MYQLNKHSLQDNQSMYMAFGLNRCIWPILICLYCKTEHISISISNMVYAKYMLKYLDICIWWLICGPKYISKNIYTEHLSLSVSAWPILVYPKLIYSISLTVNWYSFIHIFYKIHSNPLPVSIFYFLFPNSCLT